MKDIYTKNDLYYKYDDYINKYDNYLDDEKHKKEYEDFIKKYSEERKNTKSSTDEILDKLNFGEIEQYVRRKKLNNINKNK